MSRSIVSHRFGGRLTRLACFVLAIIASGCFDDAVSPAPGQGETLGSPTMPSSSPASGPAFIWAMVIKPSGACIAGATIYVVSGPYAGQTFVQGGDCDAWAYDGGVWFGNLTPGMTMTLRANAAGYTSIEMTAVAASSGQAVLFELSPVP